MTDNAARGASSRLKTDHGRDFDVLVAGAGFVGLSVAALLSGAGLRVAVADPRAGSPYRDPRASTLSRGAARVLDALDAWAGLRDRAEPVLQMEITDSRLGDVLRPVYLTFADRADAGPFAFVADNEAIHAALLDAAKRAGVRFLTAGVERVEEAGGFITTTLSDGGHARARLLVAADGAASPLRRLAGIRHYGWRYDQSSIITTVAHDAPHAGRAIQHFLEGGPFALLPMTGNRSSVVWSERPLEAERITGLHDIGFMAELERRAGRPFGPMRLAGPRAHRRLALGVADRFSSGRIVLVGDAAHAMHPLAGQGLNLGIADVAALAEAVVDAARLGGDPGGTDVLAAYEAARRLDTLTMLGATDGLARLFGHDRGPMRLLRDTGLGIVDRLPALKRGLIGRAAGSDAGAGRLMRGGRL